MTWQTALPTGQIAPLERRDTAADVLVFAAAVAMFFVYAQGWVSPLFGDKENAADGALVRLIFFPAYAVALGMLALSLPQTTRTLLRQPALVLLLGVACASLIWSAAPDQTLRRIVAIIFTSLSGVALAARYSWARMTEVMATAFALLIVGSIAACLFVPSIGRMSEIFPGAWRGLWSEKNALGGNMTFGFIICAAAAVFSPRRRWLWAGMALGALALVLASTSKTSLLALALGLAALGFVAAARRGAAVSVVVTWFAVAAVIVLATAIALHPDAFFALLGKDATLTGRTKVWAGVLHVIRDRPWLGYGYGAVWDDQSGWGPVYRITKIAGFRAGHAHNSWLQMWLEIGLAGVGACAVYYGAAMGRAMLGVYRDPGAYLAFPLVMVFTLVSLTETIVLIYNDFRWVMFVAVAAKLASPDAPAPAAPLRPGAVGPGLARR